LVVQAAVLKLLAKVQLSAPRVRVLQVKVTLGVLGQQPLIPLRRQEAAAVLALLEALVVETQVVLVAQEPLHHSQGRQLHALAVAVEAAQQQVVRVLLMAVMAVVMEVVLQVLLIVALAAVALAATVILAQAAVQASSLFAIRHKGNYKWHILQK
jgi:hypothetical protein